MSETFYGSKTPLRSELLKHSKWKITSIHSPWKTFFIVNSMKKKVWLYHKITKLRTIAIKAYQHLAGYTKSIT